MPIPSPAPDTCWLYLVRHGATRHNGDRPPRLQGRGVNDGLSDVGKRQAARTAAHVQAIPFSHVYSSPLLRAVETAAAIAEPRGLSPVPVETLAEVDVGQWEGMTWRDVEARYPDAYRAFIADPASNPFLGGEAIAQVQSRVTPTLLDLMRRHVGQSIAVVAHSVVNRAFLAGLLGHDLSRFRSVPQDNCGINIVRFRADATRVVTMNSVFHLIER